LRVTPSGRRGGGGGKGFEVGCGVAITLLVAKSTLEVSLPNKVFLARGLASTEFDDLFA
jgi:hypothetical protein